jgi:hypothetical protein
MEDAKQYRKQLGSTKAQANGAGWESACDLLARSQGMLPIVFGLQAEFRGSGKFKRYFPKKGAIDRVYLAGRTAAFLDLKTTIGKSFPFSAIDPEQINILLPIHERGWCAGYLVYFSTEDAVVFFNAALLAQVRPGTSLDPLKGAYCGSLQGCCLGTLFG